MRCDAIAPQGGLTPLVMHLSIGNDPDVQAYAAFALMEVCASNRANRRNVVDGGGITFAPDACGLSCGCCYSPTTPRNVTIDILVQRRLAPCTDTDNGGGGDDGGGGYGGGYGSYSAYGYGYGGALDQNGDHCDTRYTPNPSGCGG